MYDIQYGCVVEVTIHTFGRNLDIHTHQHVCFMEEICLLIWSKPQHTDTSSYTTYMYMYDIQYGCLMEEIRPHIWSKPRYSNKPLNVCASCKKSICTFGLNLDIKIPHHTCTTFSASWK